MFGELDKFCFLECVYFGFVYVLVFFYIVIIVFNVVCILEFKYIKIGNLGEDEEVNFKVVKDFEELLFIFSIVRVNLVLLVLLSEGIVLCIVFF